MREIRFPRDPARFPSKESVPACPLPRFPWKLDTFFAASHKTWNPLVNEGLNLRRPWTAVATNRPPSSVNGFGTLLIEWLGFGVPKPLVSVARSSKTVTADNNEFQNRLMRTSHLGLGSFGVLKRFWNFGQLDDSLYGSKTVHLCREWFQNRFSGGGWIPYAVSSKTVLIRQCAQHPLDLVGFRRPEAVSEL